MQTRTIRRKATSFLIYYISDFEVDTTLPLSFAVMESLDDLDIDVSDDDEEDVSEDEELDAEDCEDAAPVDDEEIAGNISDFF